MSLMRSTATVRIGRFGVVAWIGLACGGAAAEGQARRSPAAKPPVASGVRKAPAEVTCPAPLGVGVKTKASFCNVIAGREPEAGVIIRIPPHRGPATLTFDLHNLHLYSEEQVKAKRSFARYTATIGILTLDNTLVSRAVVQSEFRTAEDFVDRVSGGDGPRGVKAVAPTGVEPITVSIKEADDEVSLLGEKLTVEGVDGVSRTFSQAGRPIAVVSNVMVEYRPAPARPARKR